MNAKKWSVANFVVLLMVATLLVVPGIGQSSATTSSVVNKTYDLWVSQSFADRPFQPFHDCATFTKTQMCLAQCGDCGPLSEVQLGPNSIWKGEVPCGGLNLVFTGTSRNGPATAVIGASVVGNTEATNFAAEGIRDQSCSLGFATTNGKHLYSKP